MGLMLVEPTPILAFPLRGKEYFYNVSRLSSFLR
jgi:hypothetical protein